MWSSLIASCLAALAPPVPRIIGGWTNCPPSCAASCVPPYGPVPTHGGRNMSKAACLAACQPDGSGSATCDADDMGVARSLVWGPSFSSSWSGVTAVLPGRFGGNAVAPVDGDISSYPYSWVTVGGDKTSSSTWELTAEQDIVGAGAKGCAFDEEGGVSAAAAAPWIKAMRAKHARWSFVYVPQCGTAILPYNPEGGGCDYIAPMLYYANRDSYPRMDFTVGAGLAGGCLKAIQEAGWPNARVILTFQSFDAFRVSQTATTAAAAAAAAAARGATFLGNGCDGCVPGSSEGDGLLQTLGRLLNPGFEVVVTYFTANNVTLTGPYAGVIAWPSQCGGALHRCWPAMDRANIQAVIKAAGGA